MDDWPHGGTVLMVNTTRPGVELQWKVKGGGGRLGVALGDGLHNVEMSSFPRAHPTPGMDFNAEFSSN